MIKEFKPVFTYILIGINVIIFFLETFQGGSENAEIALKFGAQYTPYIVEGGEWYRIFTSMFVHFGIEHLAGNMLALMALGNHVEFFFGRLRFIVIYFISGICGSLLFFFVEMYRTDYAVSAGASGAISGLIGTVIVFAFDPALKKEFPLRRVIVGIVLLLLPIKSGVNIVAHLGGLIGGFVTSLIFYYFMKKKGQFIEGVGM
ncbi:MAG: rhomboid family intramembrane serine protease [Eubacterium sp.]|nr:rhomboid family intramembrane serine protease [Eubacterium sp.]